MSFKSIIKIRVVLPICLRGIAALVWIVCDNTLSSAQATAPDKNELPPVPAISLPKSTQTNSKATSSLPRNVTGVYLHADGHWGRELDLWPNGTYKFHIAHDYYDPHSSGGEDTSYGIWTRSGDDQIVLEPKDNSRKDRYLTKPLTLYIVPCSTRLYLLSETDFPHFRETVQKSEEPHSRYSDPPFLLRQGDDKKPVSGLPIYPARWAALLKDKKTTQSENIDRRTAAP